MPELPEVEIQQRMLQEACRSTQLVRLELRDKARFEGDASNLEGKTIVGWRRRGKYLIAELGEWSLLSHLGMTGQWILNAAPERKHQRIVLHLSNGNHIGLIDQRRFGWTWIVPSVEVDTHPRLAAMGIEPLSQSFDADALKKAVGQGKRALKQRLLDQKVIAGLGNIAISDLCWRAKVHPHRSCASITSSEWTRLSTSILDHIHYVLEVEQGEEIVYLGYEGAVNPFLCYGRADEPCPRCEARFLKGVLSGRATYWCPSCQPEVQDASS